MAREEGAPQMPLGQPKMPDAEINAIRDWIQNGLLENATSAPRTPTGPSLDYIASGLNKPAGRRRCRSDCGSGACRDGACEPCDGAGGESMGAAGGDCGA